LKSHRPPLNSKVERVGAIYLLVTVIGTVFTTSSANGADSVYLSDWYNSSMPTHKKQPCLSLIRHLDNFWELYWVAGHVHDSEKAIELFESIKLKGKKILADKAYSNEQIRGFIAEHGTVACIPAVSGVLCN